MNRSQVWARGIIYITLLGVMTIGCSPLTTLAFIFHKDEKLPPDCPLPVKTTADGKKKDSVKVAVLVTLQGNPPQELATLDRDLAQMMAKRFPEIFREYENKDKIVAISPEAISNFMRNTPSWRTMPMKTLGKRLGADYVIDITLSHLQIYQPRSSNEMYEGGAEVTVDVYNPDATTNSAMWHHVVPFGYPRMARSIESMPISQFKQQYLEKLAEKLVKLHVERKASDSIAIED